jgi:hypothetical protein
VHLSFVIYILCILFALRDRGMVDGGVVVQHATFFQVHGRNPAMHPSDTTGLFTLSLAAGVLYIPRQAFVPARPLLQGYYP